MKENKPVSSIEAEEAMQIILQAEREAEQAIHLCEQQARQAVHTAHVRAHGIHKRTDQRITNMEMRHSHKLDRMIREIEKEGAEKLQHGGGRLDDAKRLQTVVTNLAVALCCGDSTSNGELESG